MAGSSATKGLSKDMVRKKLNRQRVRKDKIRERNDGAHMVGRGLDGAENLVLNPFIGSKLRRTKEGRPCFAVSGRSKAANEFELVCSRPA